TLAWSLTSTTITRSHSGSSCWTSRASGRNEKASGTGSRRAGTAVFPSSRNPRTKPKREPTASPSGCMCDTTATVRLSFMRLVTIWMLVGRDEGGSFMRKATASYLQCIRCKAWYAKILPQFSSVSRPDQKQVARLEAFDDGLHFVHLIVAFYVEDKDVRIRSVVKLHRFLVDVGKVRDRQLLSSKEISRRFRKVL